MFSKIKNLITNGGLLSYIKSTGWLLGNKLVSLFTSVFIGIWVARYLGPTEYGVFNYLQSFVGLFTVFASLGLDGLVEREIIKKKVGLNILLGTSFTLKITASLTILLILMFSVFFLGIPPEQRGMVLIIGCSSIFSAFSVINYVFTTMVKGKYIAIAQTVSLVTISLLKVWCMLTNKPLEYFIWLLLVEAVLLAITLLYFYSTQIGSIRDWQFEANTAKNLLKDSWPLIITGFVVAIYMKIDQVMINEYLGSKAVGVYAVAARLSELWYFIPAVIADTFFPAILNAKNDKKLYLNRLKNLYSLMFLIALSIAIPITLFSDCLITLLYGLPYAEAADVLKIHVWSGIFVFMGYVFHKFLIAENWTKLAFMRTLYGAILNLILNFILIPAIGILGAAIATLLSQIVSNYLFDLTDKRLYHQFILKTSSFITLPKNIK